MLIRPNTYSIAVTEPLVAGEVARVVKHGKTANSLFIDALLRELENSGVLTSSVALGVESEKSGLDYDRSTGKSNYGPNILK